MNHAKEDALEIAEEARSEEYKHPSFAAKLFMGEFDPKLLHPFPIQDEEDRLAGDRIIDPFLDYLTKYVDPEEVDATRTLPKALIDEMAKQGIFALKVPKEYGGLGLSQTNYNRLVMAVASYCGATAVLISAHQSIGVPQPLNMYGTKEQKDKFFPRFRKGSISAFALTEIDVGSDPAMMTATATLSADGSHYLLNGQKLWCTNGPLADIIVVMARTPSKVVNGKEKKQISAFILETDTPGVTVTQRCEFMGLGGIYNGMFTFKDVKIPKENLLWAEGRGLALALGTINVGRLTLPAASTGAAKQCLAIVRRWGNSRIQWGQPVGTHEPGREKIADIASKTFALEAVTWLTSALADQEKTDIRIEAAMAKLYSSEEVWKMADETLQLRGGRGYEKARSLKARGEPGWPVERMLRDLRINRILEGSTEIMKLFLAREALEPHIKKAGALLKKGSSTKDKIKAGLRMAAFYAIWYPKQWLLALPFRRFSEMGDLAPYFRFVNKTARRLARHLFHAMLQHGPGLQNRQLLLGRFVDIGTELFYMAATCSFAVSKNDDSARALAHHFCLKSMRKINELFSATHNNDDKKVNSFAKRVLNGDFRWLEEGVVPLD